MMMLKLGSLFDGIGGWPLAAQKLGILPVWASEIEKLPVAVTSYHFPDMVQLGDIQKIDGAKIEPVDIITFGSPCQDLSIAGKREGLAGERSGLFGKAVKIIKEMQRATNGRYPKYAVWENVPGAFSSNRGMDFRKVLEEITETCIPVPRSGRWSRSGMVRSQRCEIVWRTLDAQYWGVPQRRERIFLVCNFTGRGGTEEILFKPEVLSGYSEESREKREDTPENHSGCSTRSVMMRERGGKAGGGKGPLLSEDKALTLGTHNDQTLILDISHRQEGVRIRKDTSPTLTARAGTGGNNVPVVSIGNGQADNTRLSHVAGDLNCMHDQQAIMINQCILRRLTPLECERLQGLPDNWTLIEDSKVCSDTARYKAIGNGMTQPCADFVLSRIYQYDMREDDYKNES